jgi:sec-independent protein translocase protein TatC
MNESSKPPNGDSPGSEGPSESSGDSEVKDPTGPSPEKAPPVGKPPAPPGSTRFGRSGDADDPEEAELGGRMTFLEHLDELRRRILRSVLSIIVTFVVAWIFHEDIYHFISVPILNVVDKLVVIKPTEPFTIYLKVSFMAAVFLAAPFILGQVWMFVAPGLYRNEKRFALPFLFGSTILFILGGMFSYYVVLPPALNFLLVQFGREFQPMITAVEYYDFALIIILGMGVIFQMPILVAFLSIFGMVTPGFLWRNFRYAFLIITIIAAVVSPTTDAFNLFLWSGPMVVLYTLSIGVSWVFQRRRKREEES